MAPKGADIVVVVEEANESKCLLLLGLLGEKHSLDVGEDTTLGNGDSGQELVQFLVVADSQLQVTGNDTSLLVVSGGVTCKFKYFSGQVLHDSSEVDGSASSDSFGVISLAEETVDPTDGELKSSPGGAGL